MKADLNTVEFKDNSLFILQPRYLRATDDGGPGASGSVSTRDVLRRPQIMCGAYQVYRRYPERSDANAADASTDISCHGRSRYPCRRQDQQ